MFEKKKKIMFFMFIYMRFIVFREKPKAPKNAISSLPSCGAVVDVDSFE